MWSCVGSRRNKKWIWLALDVYSGQVLAAQIGERNKKSAKTLLASIPENIRENAVFYTDDFHSYKDVLPPKRHVVNQAEIQNIAENFNSRLRARASRLVRKSFSFSKIIANHIKSIYYVAGQLNLSS